MGEEALEHTTQKQTQKPENIFGHQFSSEKNK